MSLSVDKLKANIGSYCLLEDINFRIDDGEVLTILGPNGAGKSSLLKCLSGELTAAPGVINIHGKPLEKWDRKALAKSFAILPQNSTLNFAFTVQEVLALGRTPHSTGVNVDQQIILEIIELLDLSHLINKTYPQLSGGEKQRVQLGRVLSQIWRSEDSEKRLLILDEPMNAIDISHQQTITKIIKSLSENNCKVIVVMHDFSFASQYAHKTLLLNKGKSVAFGPPEDVLTPSLLDPVFQTKFTLAPHPITKKMSVFF